jgi:hypothetical protein
MKTFAFAALAAGLLCAAPAVAQDVRIRAGEGGVTVRTDSDRDHWRGRRYGDERRWRRHRDRDVYVTGSTGCSTKVIRSERPNGTVVVRRIKRCD